MSQAPIYEPGSNLWARFQFMTKVPINRPKLSLIQSMHQGKNNKPKFFMSHASIYEPRSNLWAKFRLIDQN